MPPDALLCSTPVVPESSISVQNNPAGTEAAQLTLPDPGAGALGLLRVLVHDALGNPAFEETTGPDMEGSLNPKVGDNIPDDTKPELNVTVYGATPPLTANVTGVPQPTPFGSGEHGDETPKSQIAVNEVVPNT